jgi:ubiquitin-activating enzyme E1
MSMSALQLTPLSSLCKINVYFRSANYECVVVIDNYNKDYLIQLNKVFHSKGLGFILAGNLGLYGYTFVDFGDSHRIFDATG